MLMFMIWIYISNFSGVQIASCDTRAGYDCVSHWHDKMKPFRNEKRHEIRIKSDFVIHDFGIECLWYIETIQHKRRNEIAYEQHLILVSITLACNSLDSLRQFKKRSEKNTNKIWFGDPWLWHGVLLNALKQFRKENNKIEYEQSLILGSMTLAWITLRCIETRYKKN